MSRLAFESHLELAQRKVDAHIWHCFHLECELTSHLLFKLQLPLDVGLDLLDYRLLHESVQSIV